MEAKYSTLRLKLGSDVMQAHELLDMMDSGGRRMALQVADRPRGNMRGDLRLPNSLVGCACAVTPAAADP